MIIDFDIDRKRCRFYLTSVLGHEAVVEVVDHRRIDSNLNIGDRLTFSIADSCGNCEFCQKGLNQKCVKLFKVNAKNAIHFSAELGAFVLKYGHAKLSDGSGYNGSYATHIIIRSGTHVAKIPESISDRCAAPVNCSLATAMCALERVPKIKTGRAFVQVYLLFIENITQMYRFLDLNALYITNRVSSSVLSQSPIGMNLLEERFTLDFKEFFIFTMTHSMVGNHFQMIFQDKASQVTFTS